MTAIRRQSDLDLLESSECVRAVGMAAEYQRELEIQMSERNGADSYGFASALHITVHSPEQVEPPTPPHAGHTIDIDAIRTPQPTVQHVPSPVLVFESKETESNNDVKEQLSKMDDSCSEEGNPSATSQHEDTPAQARVPDANDSDMQDAPAPGPDGDVDMTTVPQAEREGEEQEEEPVEQHQAKKETKRKAPEDSGTDGQDVKPQPEKKKKKKKKKADTKDASAASPAAKKQKITKDKAKTKPQSAASSAEGESSGEAVEAKKKKKTKTKTKKIKVVVEKKKKKKTVADTPVPDDDGEGPWLSTSFKNKPVADAPTTTTTTKKKKKTKKPAPISEDDDDDDGPRRAAKPNWIDDEAEEGAASDDDDQFAGTYAETTNDFKKPGFNPDRFESMYERGDTDVDDDSIVVDDDHIEYLSTSPDEREVMAQERALNKKKKSGAKKKKKRVDELASARRLLQRDSDEEMFENTDVRSAAAAFGAQATARRNLSANASKGTLTTRAVDDILAEPERSWDMYALLESKVQERLLPMKKACTKMAVSPRDLAEMTSALLRIAKHFLSQNVATMTGAQFLTFVVNTMPEEVNNLGKVTRKQVKTMLQDMMAASPSNKRIVLNVGAFVLSDTIDIEQVEIGPGESYECMWTGEKINAGDKAFRVASFKQETALVRFMYVSRSPGVPTTYLHALCSLRTFDRWTELFIRTVMEWQIKEFQTSGISPELRMRKFLASDSALDVAADALAVFFANKYVNFAHK